MGGKLKRMRLDAFSARERAAKQQIPLRELCIMAHQCLFVV